MITLKPVSSWVLRMSVVVLKPPTMMVILKTIQGENWPHQWVGENGWDHDPNDPPHAYDLYYLTGLEVAEYCGRAGLDGDFGPSLDLRIWFPECNFRRNFYAACFISNPIGRISLSLREIQRS